MKDRETPPRQNSKRKKGKRYSQLKFVREDKRCPLGIAKKGPNY